MAHDRGIRALVALRGVTAPHPGPGSFRPPPSRSTSTSPIWRVRTILDRLKHDPVTRHIPVHVISGDENFAAAGWHWAP